MFMAYRTLERSKTMSAMDYQRIEQAINYLGQSFREQPDLSEVARRVHLSEYHFQRLFRRWAGISPKRFLQFLTVEYAKKLLDQSSDLLRVTYDSGLSSPGRLHDLFVNTEAVTPGEFKKRGEGVEITYGVHSSPFGDCLLATTERGICSLSFISTLGRARAIKQLKSKWPKARFRENPRATQPLFNQIFNSTKNGKPRKVNLFLQGTNFQIKVWQALLKIPSGSMLSYEDVATMIGKPGASRAVGNAISQNPIAYVIPCHRVIRKVGAIGDYRWGSARKKAILVWEAAKRNSN
jgi:AraC family transcriptional regulator of adaptative response/methylated-DNA-[protein]-cysteine methyltransferase